MKNNTRLSSSSHVQVKLAEAAAKQGRGRKQQFFLSFLNFFGSLSKNNHNHFIFYITYVYTLYIIQVYSYNKNTGFNCLFCNRNSCCCQKEQGRLPHKLKWIKSQTDLFVEVLVEIGGRKKAWKLSWNWDNWHFALVCTPPAFCSQLLYKYIYSSKVTLRFWYKDIGRVGQEGSHVSRI